MTMFSRDISGVPTLSPVNMKILLRGRGECRQIKDTPAAVVEVSPKKIRIPLKSLFKKTKLSDKNDDPDENLEVPPEKKSKLSCKANKNGNSSSISCENVVEHKENIRRDVKFTTLSLNKNIVLTENNVNQKHVGCCTEEADELTDNVREEHVTTPSDNTEILNNKVAEIYDAALLKSRGAVVSIQADVSVPKTHLRQSQVQDVQSSEQVVKESYNKNDCVGDVCLPPGYGSDKLAILLIRLLEEKVKVSASHSERELFRMTMHVLQCRGCKDREKHNKIRCRRCEERDRKYEERDRKKNAMKASQEKEQVKKVGQDVLDDLKKPTKKHEGSADRNRSGHTEKILMDKRIVANTGANVASVENNTTVILERSDEDSNGKNNVTLELNISCKTCEETFIHPGELAVHSLRCLKLHVKEHSYLEALEHEDLGKIDRDKIFEDSDDETDGQYSLHAGTPS